MLGPNCDESSGAAIAAAGRRDGRIDARVVALSSYGGKEKEREEESAARGRVAMAKFVPSTFHRDTQGIKDKT